MRDAISLFVIPALKPKRANLIMLPVIKLFSIPSVPPVDYPLLEHLFRHSVTCTIRNILCALPVGNPSAPVSFTPITRNHTANKITCAYSARNAAFAVNPLAGLTDWMPWETKSAANGIVPINYVPPAGKHYIQRMGLAEHISQLVIRFAISVLPVLLQTNRMPCSSSGISACTLRVLISTCPFRTYP